MKHFAVHVGAGYFRDSNVDKLKLLCEHACQQGLDALDAGKPVVEAVSWAVKELEDSPLTNAGIGSCLNLAGQVECDAGVMDGQSGTFGAVGAVAGIKNPSMAALRVMEEGKQGQLCLGRIPPMILVGGGARKWAIDHGLEACHPDTLLTQQTKAYYVEHMEKLESASKRARFHAEDAGTLGEEMKGQMDTVGAVGVSSRGDVAAACSSGGIPLKFPGRLGQASCFGSGCWAVNGSGNDPGICVCTTGCGEHLIRTSLAKECGAVLSSSPEGCLALKDCLNKRFIAGPGRALLLLAAASPLLSGVDQKFGGVLSLLRHRNGCVEVGWAHTTDHMIVAFYDTAKRKVTSHFSQMNARQQPGHDVAFGMIAEVCTPDRRTN